MTAPPQPALPRPVPSRATVAVLTVGSLASAVLFLGAIVLVAAGRGAAPAPGVEVVAGSAFLSGPALDPASALAGIADLDPRAWASMGVLVLLAAPVAGLVTSLIEFWRPDRRFALVALLVLVVLAVSLGLAWLR
jgi:uncharacterized membrane protein